MFILASRNPESSNFLTVYFISAAAMTATVTLRCHPSRGDVRPGPTAPQAVVGEEPAPAPAKVTDAATVRSRSEYFDVDPYDDPDVPKMISNQANVEYYELGE